MIAGIAVALGAAVLLALGFVIQQRVAAEEPPNEVLRISLLLHLARRPRWLLGIAAMIGGQVLGATALSMADLGLVEPVLAANLLFALLISAAWTRRRLARREWLGALALAGGLAMFVVVAAPHGGKVLNLPWPNWALSMGAIVAVAAVLVACSRLGGEGIRASMLAAAAGVLFGLQDALTRRTLAVLPRHGIIAVITQWATYMLVAVAICALLLAQSAFEAAPLPASLPAITLAEPVTGIAFGASVFSEHIGLGPAPLAAEIVSLAVGGVGVWVIGRSTAFSEGGALAAAREAPLDPIADRRQKTHPGAESGRIESSGTTPRRST